MGRYLDAAHDNWKSVPDSKFQNAQAGGLTQAQRNGACHVLLVWRKRLPVTGSVILRQLNQFLQDKRKKNTKLCFFP